MSIITLTSDYGYKDYYVSALKAKLLSEVSGIQIVDISHEIAPFNVKEGAFVLKNALAYFPEKTIHLFIVNEGGQRKDGDFLLIRMASQIILGTGRGFVNALGDSPDEIILLDKPSGTFPAIEVFLDVIKSISEGAKPESLGEIQNMMGFQSDLHLQNDLIIGAVVYVDNYGNLVTNIHQSDFEKIQQGREFDINFGREHVRQIQQSYLNIEPSESACIFNSAGYLEILVSLGDASRLLGLKVGSQVKIDFKKQ